MNDASQPHDHFFRYLFSQPEVAADFFKHYLPPEIVAALDLRELPELVKDSFLDERLREHLSDVLYRVRLRAGGATYISILLEHKSAPEKDVALQILGYQVRAWEQALVEGAKELQPILPVVFYHGPKRWKVPLRLSGFINFKGAEMLRDYVPEFKYHLCDLSQLDDATLARGAARLQTGLAALRHVFADEIDDRLSEILDPMTPVTEQNALEYIKTVLVYLTQASRKLTEPGIRRAVQAKLPAHEGEVMETLATRWMRQGHQQGRQEGLQEGVQIGQQKLALDWALRLLQRQLDRPLDSRLRARLAQLSVAQLNQLSEALFEFKTVRDLTKWLRENAAQTTE